VVQFLRRRDASWRLALAQYVDGHSTPAERVLAVYDWLHQWFSEQAFHDYLAALVDDAGRPEGLADQLLLLAEGAITTSAIAGTPEPVHQVREAARLLLRARAAAITRRMSASTMTCTFAEDR